jgi:sensor histidine kinase regulating citrate/malate metabolism
MGKLFDEIKSGNQHHDSFQIEVKINLKEKKVPIRRETFVDAIKNIITNASEHAFSKPLRKNKVRFVIDENNQNVMINCLNNGAPLPRECNENWFSTFGQRGARSEGEGCGGCIIENSIVKAHGGTIKFINKSNWAFHLRLYLPKQFNREE